MRTTVNLDDDVLAAARGIARRRGLTIGQVVSSLVRQALKPSLGPDTRNGVPLLPLPDHPVPVTLDLVNDLRDGDDPR